MGPSTQQKNKSFSIQVTLLGVRMICGLLLFSSVLFGQINEPTPREPVSESQETLPL